MGKDEEKIIRLYNEDIYIFRICMDVNEVYVWAESFTIRYFTDYGMFDMVRIFIIFFIEWMLVSWLGVVP